MTSSKLYRKKQTNYSSNTSNSLSVNSVRSTVSNLSRDKFSLRSNNTPIQYQKGFVEFYKLKFKVTPDVLIPRPETELLVDYVVDFVNSLSRENENTSIRVLDIGTGAGNIAISVAKNSKDIKIIATDVSEKALKIAKQNAKLHGVLDKIEFLQSDLLNNCHPEFISGSQKKMPKQVRHDRLIIVTNLPYIPSARIPYLDPSVKDFEPHVALDGGDDGFELYRKLFEQLKEKNIKFYLLVGEIDYTHGELALFESQKYFPKANIEVKLDLYHRQRILIIKNYMLI